MACTPASFLMNQRRQADFLAWANYGLWNQDLGAFKFKGNGGGPIKNNVLMDDIMDAYPEPSGMFGAHVFFRKYNYICSYIQILVRMLRSYQVMHPNTGLMIFVLNVSEPYGHIIYNITVLNAVSCLVARFAIVLKKQIIVNSCIVWKVHWQEIFGNHVI